MLAGVLGTPTLLPWGTAIAVKGQTDRPTVVSSKMESTMSTTIDTLLSRSPNICGGRIRIEGTRVTVLQIVTCYQQGLTPEEIADQYPHINLAQIYAALTYYHANRDEIDRELEAEAADYVRLADEFAKPQE
jgi:uncharacterized protein (DUF433 family)